MARKTIDVTISDDNRDKGKAFRITEMPATKAEKWGMRAISALIKAGAEVPENLETAGMAAIAAMGLQSLSKIPFEDVEPLLAEMFDCIRLIPDPVNPNIERALIDNPNGMGDDIEEVKTRLLLRKEVLQLHLGFSLGAGG